MPNGSEISASGQQQGRRYPGGPSELYRAHAAYQKSREIRERLAATDPSNASWQRNLSFAFSRLAELHERREDRAEALRLAKLSLAISERLAALDPTKRSGKTMSPSAWIGSSAFGG